MAYKTSAGILLWDLTSDDTLLVFIAHMGGPYWAGQDRGAWSLPKGEYDASEQPLQAARREFAEEIGVELPDIELDLLGSFPTHSGKIITAFAGRYPSDKLSFVASNTFHLEWPPHSGRRREFPEMDGAAWLPARAAKTKLMSGQVQIVEALEAKLAGGP